MTECTIGNLIESLEKFPKDKPVKILALGIEHDCSEETIHSVETEQLSDKEKVLLILEKAKNAFNECGKQLRETQTAFMKLTSAVETANDNLKRVLNEEENNGNIHKKCEYYNLEKDYCSNYLMGKYTGLAFEVSRHKSCIKDLVE